jgi:hypothetical protein
MKTYTHEEIKSMVGTEFIFTEGDDQVNAIIAAFDPDTGFTCLAMDDVTARGTSLDFLKDKNGNICLVGLDKELHYSSHSDFIKEVSLCLNQIRYLGYFRAGLGVDSDGKIIFFTPGQANCSF